MNPMMDSSGWRLDADHPLHGEVFTVRRYQPITAEWDHEHCEICSASFEDPTYSERARELVRAGAPDRGFTTSGDGLAPAGEHWICPRCFEKVREPLALQTVASDPDTWPYARPEPPRRWTIEDYDGAKAFGPRPEPDHRRRCGPSTAID